MHVRKIFSSQKASFSRFLYELDPSLKLILEITYKSYTFWYLHRPALSRLFDSGRKDVVHRCIGTNQQYFEDTAKDTSNRDVS